MINLVLISSGITTLHTSTHAGIGAFFTGNTWRIPTAGGYTFTHNYSPGIPVLSSVEFSCTNTSNGQKQSRVIINPGSSNSVSSSTGVQNPVLNFSGVINSLKVESSTSDIQGDDFSFSVQNIDGSTDYTRLSSTTMSIP